MNNLSNLFDDLQDAGLDPDEDMYVSAYAMLEIHANADGDYDATWLDYVADYLS